MRVSRTTAEALSARYWRDGLGEHLLGEPLEVAVDGGAQRRTVLGGLERALAQRDPHALAGVGLPRGLAVDTGQLLVEGALEAAERLVGAHVADQVGGHVAGGVVDRIGSSCEADALEAGVVEPASVSPARVLGTRRATYS